MVNKLQQGLLLIISTNTNVSDITKSTDSWCINRAAEYNKILEIDKYTNLNWFISYLERVKSMFITNTINKHKCQNKIKKNGFLEV